MKVSVIVPVFNSANTLDSLVCKIFAALGDQCAQVVLVNDASQDNSWDRVRTLSRMFPGVVGVNFGRNYGQHSATLAGIRMATSEVVVTIDDDLQFPPDQIPYLLQAMDETQTDVVYGVPKQTAQPIWRRTGSLMIRYLFRTSLGVANATETSSFRAFRTRLRESFANSLGPGVSIDALLAWGTDSFASIEVEHQPRQDGSSNYSLTKLWRFAVDATTGYSATPLRIASSMGFFASAIGVSLMAYVILMALLTENGLPGFPFLASTVIFFSGVQLVTLGIIGEYLSRMHFRIMHKPEYVISEITDLRSL